MTVREIFELRKSGETEEAWVAIQPMYAVHQGHYTTLCYFWTACDMAQKALEQNHIDEAKRLLYLMTQAYEHMNDQDHKADMAIIRLALKIDKVEDNFNLVYFMPYFNRLPDEGWKAHKANDHWVPALGQIIVDHLFKNLEERATADYLTQVVPFFKLALQKSPNDKNLQVFLARLQLLRGPREEARQTLLHLYARYRDAQVCHLLAQASTDVTEKTGWLCQAINFQRMEKFRSKMRVELAVLIQDKYPGQALYELQKSRQVRTALGFHVPQFAQALEQKLQGTTPATEQEHTAFYLEMIRRLSQLPRG